MIFYLPINTYYFFKFLRISRDLEKNAIEIDYIYSQLENKMENNEKGKSVLSMPVINKTKDLEEIVGIIRLHDLIQIGLK